MMNIWYEKIKSISTSSSNFNTVIVSFKKNGMVPAMTAEELSFVLEKHPEVKDIFIDVTERSMKRNKDRELQQKDYS